jgi:membrane protein YqaA with SNARE-associated domain
MEPFTPLAGYASLLGLSFLASTVLPVGSEWLVVALLLQGFEPGSVVAVATGGNTLGAFTTYAIGLWGGQLLVRRFLRIDDRALSRAQRLYTRFGAWSLLLSWVPIVGDPLCALAGLFRTPWRRFALLVILGKLARYIAVAWVTIAATPR